MNSREAAIVALGEDAVRSYERVKTFYTRYGNALERAFADEVDGRLGETGEADVVTHLGGFEFCAQGNTKNSAGDAAQRGKVPAGHVVQVAGRPRAGRITAEEFLRLHAIERPERAASECQLRALQAARVDAIASIP